MCFRKCKCIDPSKSANLAAVKSICFLVRRPHRGSVCKLGVLLKTVLAIHIERQTNSKLSGRAREAPRYGLTSRAQPRNFTQSGLERLIVRPVEEVVCRVGHQLSLTHGAGGGRNRSAVSVQALDEGGFEQEVPAAGPPLVPYGLQL